MAQSILRDADTEAYLKEIAAPLVAAAACTPGNVDIALIGDSEITPSSPRATVLPPER